MDHTPTLFAEADILLLSYEMAVDFKMQTDCRKSNHESTKKKISKLPLCKLINYIMMKHKSTVLLTKSHELGWKVGNYPQFYKWLNYMDLDYIAQSQIDGHSMASVRVEKSINLFDIQI